MHAAKVARNLRERIGRFSGNLSKGLKRPSQRFVAEMVYGIQAAQSVMLAEIGRTLQEPTKLRKTHMRLSRNLKNPELEDTLQDNLVRMAALSLPPIFRQTPREIKMSYACSMPPPSRAGGGDWIPRLRGE